jgi:hypothetical protein
MYPGGSQGTIVRRTRALAGQSDEDEAVMPAPARASLPAELSREEEAIVIAERLAALVESRRAGAPVPAVASSPAKPSRSGPAAPVVGARHSGRLLGNLLLTRGFLVESELQYVLARQSSTGGPIGEILVELGLITERDLIELLAEQLRMHLIDVSRVNPDREMLSLLPRETARRLAALPLRRVDGQIEIAVADPTDENAVGELTRLLGTSLRLFLASKADIEAAVDRLYS